MILIEEREKVVEYGIRLVTANLTKGTGGNISIFNRDKKLMAISPSGIEYEKIKPKDVVIMSLDGDIIDGERAPSSEFLLHKIFYENRDDISAMVHTHSRYATTLACLNWALPPIHYMVAVAGIDVRCAKYATFGTRELAINAYEAMVDRKAVLLANHGLLAGDMTIERAFNIAEEIEYCAELYYRAKSIGDPIILNNEEMSNMIEKFKSYGQNKNN
ncbi:L-fuculose-phosphate aldolase [Tissierella creatinini]|nr:L-fuculose-phosphate aldolase [Tissierella creatinini]TJX63055.1 L-fuculose-phosphate aldolase [Soehngenia saccharolytica]